MEKMVLSYREFFASSVEVSNFGEIEKILLTAGERVRQGEIVLLYSSFSLRPGIAQECNPYQHDKGSDDFGA